MSYSKDFINQKLIFIAHELHTPLMLIKHYAELIRESDETEIKTFSAAIESLSQELIDSSQFMLQKVAADQQVCLPDNEPLDLQAFVVERITRFAPLIKQKEIRFENQVPINTQARISSDCLKIVLNNLISNALKFTPPKGCITIALKANTLKVIDTAITIDEIEREKIFEAFHKVANQESQTGFGLGLHICTELVHSWGGEISLHPNPPTGNQFCFTLPE